MRWQSEVYCNCFLEKKGKNQTKKIICAFLQVRLSKDRKKGEKIVSDSQERAFWRVYRPPPGCMSSLELVPIPTRARPGVSRSLPRKRTLNDVQREVSGH